MWELEPLRCRHVITLRDGSSFVEDMAFSEADSTRLMVAGLGKFYLYDLISGNCIRDLDTTDYLCSPLVYHDSLSNVPESVWEVEWQDQRPGVAKVTKLRRNGFLGLVYGFHPHHRSGSPYGQYVSVRGHWPAAVNNVPDVLTEVSYELEVAAQWSLEPPGNAYWYGLHRIATIYGRQPSHLPVCLVNICKGKHVAWLCIWESASQRWSTLQLPIPLKQPGQQLSAYDCTPCIDKETGRMGVVVIQRDAHGLENGYSALRLAKRRMSPICLMWMSRVLRLSARIISIVHDAIPDNWELQEQTFEACGRLEQT